MEGVHTLFAPELPSAARIRQLQTYIEDLEKFKAEVGSQQSSQPYCPLREGVIIAKRYWRMFLQHSSSSREFRLSKSNIVCFLCYDICRQALWVCSQAFHVRSSTQVWHDEHVWILNLEPD